MQTILEISDVDVGVEPKPNPQYRPRTAARAIILHNGNIPLLHVSKHQYYKLPGGGVDEGETIHDALHRELKEEVGCKADITDEVGEVIEHRSHFELVQTSHCFLAELIEEGEPNFEASEIAAGFRLVWVPIEKAITLIQESIPDEYEGKFIVKRDLLFLRKAQELISSKTT